MDRESDRITPQKATNKALEEMAHKETDSFGGGCKPAQPQSLLPNQLRSALHEGVVVFGHCLLLDRRFHVVIAAALDLLDGNQVAG